MRTSSALLLATLTACGAASAQPSNTQDLTPGKAAQVPATVPGVAVGIDGPGAVVLSQGADVRGVLIVPRSGKTTLNVPVAALADGSARPIDISVLRTSPGEINVAEALRGYCVTCNPGEPVRCCPWLQLVQ